MTSPNPQIEAALATRDRFKAWLQNRNPNAIVGVQSSCVYCPIAVWLVDDLSFGERYQTLEVTSSGVGVMDALTPKQAESVLSVTALPEWAREFIKRIDASSLAPFVSVERALEALH